MKISPELKSVLDDIVRHGGHPYFVGGCVRDYLLNIPYHDLDIEVYNLTLQQLHTVLSTHGQVNQFGRSFAIIQIAGIDADFALPRTETKTGDMHTDFEVSIDPFMPLNKAIQRRDLTMNALMYDYINKTIVDHCGGIEDINNEIIRCVNPSTFIEDPLRVLRIAQFKSRFNFKVEKNTFELCKDMVKKGMLDHLSIERIYEEYTKILMSSKPSIGFEFLRDIEALPDYLSDMINTQQRTDYHSEGNVFNHTMLVIDVGALIRHKTSNPLGFMWACLLHDIGKPSVTTKDLKAPYHAKVGAELFKDIDIIRSKKLRGYISCLIEYHMTLMNIARFKKGKINYYTLLKAIDNKVPVNDLYYISAADKLGRGSVDINEYNKKMEYINNLIKEYGTKALEPLITGKDLISININNKSLYKNILEEAYQLQLSGYTKEDIYRRIKNNYE